jgi:hypothetical protein
MPLDIYDGIVLMAAAERTTISHIMRRAAMLHLIQNGVIPAPQFKVATQQTVAA